MSFKVTLKVQYPRKESLVDIEVENKYHLTNIMVGYLVIGNEKGQFAKRVDIVKPKWLIKNWNVRYVK